MVCLFTALLLSACAESTPMPGDLIALNARATLAVITEQVQETRSSSIEATRQAGIQSAKLEAEAALISTQAAIRQQDLVAQVTQAALDSSRATQAAAPLLATQQAIQTQPALDATATAIAVGSAIAVQSERRADLMTWAYPLGWLIICITISICLWNLSTLLYARLDLQAQVIETKSGTLRRIWDPLTQTYILEKVETHTIRNLDPGKSQAPVATLSAGGVTYTSPMDNDAARVRKDVVRLLKKAQELNGEDAIVLPSDEKMGWSSGKWQFIISVLRANGLAVTEPSKGTYVAERWGNVDNILYEMEIGKIKLQLRPSPTPGYRSRDG